MSKICCFIGHRNVKKTAKLREKLTDKNNDWKVVKIFSETGKLGNLTLWDLRLMAKHKEFDYLLLKDFETFSMPPDESMEEVRYLIENGVEVRTLNDGNLTCESLPTLFRNRFKIFVGKRKYN